MQILNMTLSALLQGMCYALVALGVYISYKILNFPDLTVDGTFPLGGVVSVVLINSGINPIIAVLCSVLCGAGAGFLTGFLHVKFNISNLLSGILVMTALITVNLNIGKFDGNVRVLISYDKSFDTFFSNGFVNMFTSTSKLAIKALILAAIVIVSKIIIDRYLKTKSGFMLRAAGENEQLVTSMGKKVGFYKIAGLMIANAMVALGGSVYSQQMNYYDNSSGLGMVVIALASVIIGCAMLRNVSFVKGTTSVIIGAILYSGCLSAVVYAGIETTFLKLIMAALFTVILIVNNKITGKNNIIRGLK